MFFVGCCVALCCLLNGDCCWLCVVCRVLRCCVFSLLVACLVCVDRCLLFLVCVRWLSLMLFIVYRFLFLDSRVLFSCSLVVVVRYVPFVM